MTTSARRITAAPALGAVLLALLLALPAHAQQGSVHDLVQNILRDVVDRAVVAARAKARESTGIDVTQRGYRKDREHRPLPHGASDESRRELRKLQQEHDRKIAKLEEELQRKLHKARAEFAREAAREDKREKVREKRRKLEEKVEASYQKFDRKVDEENARFDEKRKRILAKAR